MEADFLAGKEVHNIRPLWETVFAEDSREFTEYYFTRKAEQNLVFVRKEGEQIVSMLHLTPYLTDKIQPVCYIVGVATHADYRRRGLMDSLIKEALQFLWEEHHGFAFLMPANPTYYTPYGFSYIYGKPEWKLNEGILPVRYLDAAASHHASFHLVVKGSGNWLLRCAQKQDCAGIASFANEELKKNYDCFMLRNAKYYENMRQELLAQKGNLFLLQQDDKIEGLLSYVHENNKPGLQEVILTKKAEAVGFVTAEEHKAAIMGRIIRPECFLGQLECEGKTDLYLQIEDTLIPGSSGMYHLFTKANSGKLNCVKLKEVQTGVRKANCSITAEKLTQFGFGRVGNEVFETITKDAVEEKRIRDCLAGIKPIRRVFINEIV